MSLLRCACLCYAVLVFVTLYLSLFHCARVCYAVPVFVTLYMSLLRCTCLCYAVPVFYSKWFEPRSISSSYCVIVQVSVALKRTVVGD